MSTNPGAHGPRPFVATLEKSGLFHRARVFDVTTLDVVRAAKLLSSISGVDPSGAQVTVATGDEVVKAQETLPFPWLTQVPSLPTRR